MEREDGEDRMTLRAPALPLALAALALALASAATAQAAGPAPLSADDSRADIASTHGSGAFGAWTVDRYGLPAYRYDIDEEHTAFAQQPELDGSTDAWHQVGNDHIVANAYNHGYTQLWSQDRLYQWTNRYDATTGHFAGGYGYLNVGGRTVSTLYDDRPSGADAQRVFAPGAYDQAMDAAGLHVSQQVVAPFGDDPILVHQVTLKNTTRKAIKASWFEYWDVNPYLPGAKKQRGLDAPVYSRARQTLTVRQAPEGADDDPLTIYAAALRGPVSGFDTDRNAFFGSGGRAKPAAVARDRARGSIAQPVASGSVGNTLLAFRSPVTVKPGASVTLRYAYGAAHAARIPGLVRKYGEASDPVGASARGWAGWLPQASFGRGREWLSRELQWDAYMVRSGSTYEECHGAHILSQGGYYQYALSIQAAFRDPLQHMLPMIYADPALARDVLRYSAGEQKAGSGSLPYAVGGLCARQGEDGSDDPDLWLLNAATEYVLGTRDFAFLDQQVPYADGSTGTMWEHLRLSYQHQEAVGRGPHGGYLPETAGDWMDGGPKELGLTESMLVPAQLAYVYPRLAQLADHRGEGDFASALRANGAGLAQTVSDQWTGLGWYTRGWAGDKPLGSGAIFGEPQPWAILAGIPDASRAATLVGNIKRFLTGVGAPGGPTKIGSSLVPGNDDPEVTERSAKGVGDNNSNYTGGTWFAVNGWLVWALGTLEGVVPGAVQYAWDEFERNTLAGHATAFPRAWDGIITVDDACWSYYSTSPGRCGIGLVSYATQILHQPAWTLFDAIRLGGVTPTSDGYRIDPHLPFRDFSLRLPVVGVARSSSGLRGYVRPEGGGPMTLEVRAPRGRVVTWAGGRRVAHTVDGGFVRFVAPARRGAAVDWAVVAD
jgi:Glycosyl hydrolase 36 superfamily, catalytic domain/Glycosyltransferase family 36